MDHGELQFLLKVYLNHNRCFYGGILTSPKNSALLFADEDEEREEPEGEDLAGVGDDDDDEEEGAKAS